MPSLKGFSLPSWLRSILRFIRGEPLAQFAIAASLLFLVYLWSSGPEQEAIVIAPETVPAIAQQTALLGRPLTSQEREALLSQYVDEEMLLREAQKLDLAHKDGDVRQTLLDKMSSLLSGEPPEPTPEELKDYLNANRYRLPPLLVSFDQVFFQRGGKTTAKNPQEVLTALRQGADFCKLGDPSLPTLRRISEQQLSHDLGAEFAPQVFALKVGEWAGPLESSQGTHFVRVTEKLEPSRASFEELESNLRDAWLIDQRREALLKKLTQLRKQYHIDLSAVGGK